MIDRRTFLAMSAVTLAQRAIGAPTSTTTTSLRFLKVRGRTLLVDIAGRRALIDPCFAADLGASILFSSPDASVAPDEVGDVDIVLIGAREPGAFDGNATAALRSKSASCFVPDDECARILRHQGFRRVRVVEAGDRFTTRGIDVTVSPSRALFGGSAVGFHVAHGGRSLWHAGAPPPLDVDDGAARFAQSHDADVVAACALGLTMGGAPRTLDREDALLLASLAHARYAVLLDDDVGVSALGSLVVKSEPGALKLPAGAHTRPLVVEDGRWYRVLPVDGT